MKNNKYRNCSGELCYTLKMESDGKVFEVVKRKNRLHTIDEVSDCIRKDAVMYDGTYIWQNVPKFTSFIQAVSFLKKNVEKFL